ncbi:MAG: hypothetical protein J0I06_12115, partial [Planctomycetes bacterium]|nr:hypothetical protein [Planctomycetota bacterium]
GAIGNDVALVDVSSSGGGGGGGGGTTETVTIGASDPSAAEREAGQAADPGQFVLTRQGNLSTPLTVNYTLSGTAVNGQDYATLSGQVTFAAGSATATIDVNVLDNAVVDGTRTVTIALAAGTGYTFASGAGASVSIADNDAPPTLTITASDPAASETGPDTGTFTVTRTGPTTAALVVNYTVGGSATPGADYAALSGSVTIPVGQSSATFTVTPVDDADVEGNETVVVTLASGGSATVTIADNDALQENSGGGFAGVSTSGLRTITPPVMPAPIPGMPFTGMATGDLDGDGTADVVATVAGGIMVVYDGATGAPRMAFNPVPGYTGGGSMAVGDLDGDGRGEIVMGFAELPVVAVFDGLTGQFRSAFLVAGGLPHGVSATVADLDGDGKGEIVAGANFGSADVLFVYNADHSLRQYLVLPSFGATVPPPMRAGDLNGDGADDLRVVLGPVTATFDGRTFGLMGVSPTGPEIMGGIFVG